jgi:hypothetical protein
MTPPDGRPHSDIPAEDLNFAGSLSAPFFWVVRDGDNVDHFKNGTVSFVDTGSSVFAVTACHVIDECLADAKLPGFVQCMIGGDGTTLYFRLEDRLIDKHPKIDLATMRVTREEVVGIGCSVLAGIQLSWPPPLSQVDYAVAFCGYPGLSRKLIAPRTLMFGRVALGSNVSSSHESCIKMLVERDQMYRCLGKGELAENYNFGGMSGGPVVALAERGSIRGWIAAGVIFDGPNPGDDPSQDSIAGFELFSARPIHFVKKDGQLDVDRWENLHP